MIEWLFDLFVSWISFDVLARWLPPRIIRVGEWYGNAAEHPLRDLQARSSNELWEDVKDRIQKLRARHEQLGIRS